MTHLRCPGCGMTVEYSGEVDTPRPCQWCLMRTTVRVQMQPDSFARPQPHLPLLLNRRAA